MLTYSYARVTTVMCVPGHPPYNAAYYGAVPYARRFNELSFTATTAQGVKRVATLANGLIRKGWTPMDELAWRTS